MNAQENYEQLKRRNRRRLVGALLMVAIAAILLAIMLSRRTPQPVPAPQLDIMAASASKAASADTQSTSAVILEPVASAPASSVTVPVAGVNSTVPEALTASEAKSGSAVSGSATTPQMATPHVKRTETVTTNAAPVKTPAHTQTTQQGEANSASNRPSLHSARSVAENGVVASVPADKKALEKKRLHNTQNVPESRTKGAITRPADMAEKNTAGQMNKATNSQNHNEVTAKQNKKNNEAASTAGKATAKSAITGAEKKTATAPKTVNKTVAPAKQAPTAKPANNAGRAKNGAAADKLTPQQILENKAAGTVAKKAGSNQGSTSNSKAVVERTVIQIGAYTTEAQANQVQQRLAVAGVATTISSSQTSKGTLYRVRSRVYNSRSQAMQNLDKVRAVGLDGLVIGL
ncbi:MAG: SPOR domain-containing protein [Snodgrassella sp.]|uniref:SPOR domain-containing protein n=1 Tax=Snodgrassella sp. TaxID=2815304 RepID=UPI002589189B|nr:SPOR domain-containing protein [Snodgrassella sp.]MCO6507703.1 SPOR domain-containing protein [Snodgrassella sp.]